MKKRVSLPHSQLYDCRYATVQRRESSYNKSLENLHIHLDDLKKDEYRRIRAEEKARKKELDAYGEGKTTLALAYLYKHTFAHLGEDWVFLAILGILVAIISYTADKAIEMCGKGKMWLYNDAATEPFAKYIGWISLPICLILFDVGFVHYVGPQAAGSGVPHLKTMLRGVVLKEYLTFRVLIAKWVGVACTLGSGMPLGKEGPLIHMSSIIMTKMSKLISSFHGIYQNKSKKIEMLGAAWAVGVACTFNSPIGGVLFSVEIATAYYAVRNYWRGFFAAVWGATTYRLLSVWIDGADTIQVVFKTSFFVDFPYDPLELIVFAILGLICGLCGSFYIWCKQNYDNWLSENKRMIKIRSISRFIYPGFVALLVSSVTFPLGIGQFIAADLNSRDQVVSLFSNFTWTNDNLTVAQENVLSHWTTKWTGIYTNLVCFIAYQFIISIISSAMPIPNGCFIPNFRSGAAIGRIVGELMHAWFPQGVRYGGKITQIMPGAYATVGAAAYGGAVTHTMSACVILFEMTSQITHVIPVLIAVLIAIGVASLLTPSLYDIVIHAKKLPYLPDLLPNSSAIYNVYVEHFMIREVKFIFLGMNYHELRAVLLTDKKIKTFPLVDHPQNMILLGSVSRQALVKLIEQQIGRERRYAVLQTTIKSEIKEEPVAETKVESEEEKEPETTSSVKEEDEIEKERQRIFNKYLINKRTSLPRTSANRQRGMHMPCLRVCDLTPDQQKEWEIKEMEEEVDFTKCTVDPAPFQLVERTSLLKVHSLFSMLAINLAYVTTIGRLVGVVGLTELRIAIEEANSGNLPRKSTVEEGQTLLAKITEK